MFVSRKKYNQLCMLISELTLNYMNQREEYAELKKELAELKDQLKPIQDFIFQPTLPVRGATAIMYKK